MKKNYFAQTTMHADEKALNLFAEMMIEKIQSIDTNWEKPWFSSGCISWPKNLSGRSYNGMNALMLLMHCEKEGYQIPRFCTFDCVQRMNKENKKGEPRVTVKKGEHSFPVMLTTFTCIHNETQEKISYSDYKALDKEEKKEYSVFPRMQVYRVFNIDQTNMAEAKPELYGKIKSEYVQPETENRDLFSFEPVDYMIETQKWICPIKPTRGDNAYFSTTRNEVVIPLKEQFKNGESFYSNLFHEMAHSTGHETQLNRIKPTKFGTKEYAREELVAELTAALVAVSHGITKNIKEDSAAYLKSWLNSLKEDPTFIKTVLFDVKRAASMLNKGIEECAALAEKSVVVA